MQGQKRNSAQRRNAHATHVQGNLVGILQGGCQLKALYMFREAAAEFAGRGPGRT